MIEIKEQHKQLEAAAKTRAKSFMGLYVVRDEVSNVCAPPFDAVNDQVAARKFNDMRSQWPNPREYSLIKVGQIEEGQLTLIPDMYVVIQGQTRDHIKHAEELYPE
jgi:hypothetical protein